jgi:hypothetical protein
MIAELATKHPGGNRQDCSQDECHVLWRDICGYVWAVAIDVKLLERVLDAVVSGQILCPEKQQGIMTHIISHPETCLGQTSI